MHHHHLIGDSDKSFLFWSNEICSLGIPGQILVSFKHWKGLVHERCPNQGPCHYKAIHFCVQWFWEKKNKLLNSWTGTYTFTTRVLCCFCCWCCVYVINFVFIVEPFPVYWRVQSSWCTDTLLPDGRNTISHNKSKIQYYIQEMSRHDRNIWWG